MADFITLVHPVTGERSDRSDAIPRFQRVVGWLKGEPLVLDLRDPEAKRATVFISFWQTP